TGDTHEDHPPSHTKPNGGTMPGTERERAPASPESATPPIASRIQDHSVRRDSCMQHRRPLQHRENYIFSPTENAPAQAWQARDRGFPLAHSGHSDLTDQTAP